MNYQSLIHLSFSKNGQNIEFDKEKCDFVKEKFDQKIVVDFNLLLKQEK